MIRVREGFGSFFGQVGPNAGAGVAIGKDGVQYDNTACGGAIAGSLLLQRDPKGCSFKEGPRPVSGPWLWCYFRRRRREMRIVTVIALTGAIVTVNVMMNIRCLLSPKR
jgi:hypothetical protein